eukprot:UN30476
MVRFYDKNFGISFIPRVNVDKQGLGCVVAETSTKSSKQKIELGCELFAVDRTIVYDFSYIL